MEGAGPRRDPADRRPVLGDGLADRARDLWDTWRHDPRFGLAVLVAVAVVAGVLWYRIGTGDDAVARPSAGNTTPSTAATPSDMPTRASGEPVSPVANEGSTTGLIVHVAGAVLHPGVVELDSGARVIDAVEAAGGGLTDADLDRLNLAAKVVDGQRVLVQRVGDPPVPDAAVADPGGGAGGPDGAATTTLVDLNSATSVQLEELPGIGPALAEAIITERTRRGGFRSVNELRDVRGIGEKRFADLADLVTV